MRQERRYISERLRGKWQEGRGVAEQRFSITESTALLDIDRVTLMRWLRLDAIQPVLDPRDRRYKYLSREQLNFLAREHGRVIRDETSIGPRLSRVQQDMLARIQQLEEDVALLKRERDARLTRLQPQQSLYVPPVIAPSVEPKEPSESGYVPLQQGEYRQLPPIPDGWRTPREMARELGVPERSFDHSLRPRYPGDKESYGDLDYHQGRWRGRHPGTLATQLLDEEQQAAARARFSR